MAITPITHDAAVEALLARLDPRSGPCRVEGCVHLDAPEEAGEPAALAA